MAVEMVDHSVQYSQQALEVNEEIKKVTREPKMSALEEAKADMALLFPEVVEIKADLFSAEEAKAETKSRKGRGKTKKKPVNSRDRTEKSKELDKVP